MAKMYPDEVEKFTTPGEKEVYNFLRCIARPDTEHIAWYSPDIEDREPDFILFSVDCGLIVLEVKDWIIGQILEMDPKTALLQIGNRQERRKQPLAQAREYVNNILSLMSKHGQEGDNKRCCPVTWGAVLPHISRQDWHDAGFDKVADPNRIIFWDELQDTSPLRKDLSGKSFRDWLSVHFTPLFNFTLTETQKEWLRNLIFPIVRLNLPHRAGAAQQSANIQVLDQDQENLARNMGSNRLLLQGPAGSGKTLILATRAWHLPRVDKNVKKVLVTCFNLSLAGYIRRLVTRRGAAFGPNGVEIIPFYKLCEMILGEPLAHTNENLDYYQMVIEECRERLAGPHPLKGNWDAIMVDEGQDFSPAMAEVILGLTNHKTLLSIAEDENQTLYKEGGSTWETLGISGLKKYALQRQYRNTRQIASHAAQFLGVKEPATTSAEGSKPEILQAADIKAKICAISDKIVELAREGQPLSEIAVLYFSSRNGSRKNFPEALLADLETHGLLARWLNRDITSKSFYDITTDSVTVSTVHSVKGMDYANVFLADFDHIDPENEQQKRLAYVGMTRARERLFIYSHKSV